MIIEDFFYASTISFIATSSSVAFSKSSFNKIGFYNTSFRTGQDIDLWIRYALQYDIAFNPVVTMIYNNFDTSSLSKSNYNIDRYNLINAFNIQEQKNSSLKKYLDINRYAVAIRCKINDELSLSKKIRKEIDYKNLNLKQKTLLHCPVFFLQILKTIHLFLKKTNIYLTAYN